MQGSRHLEETKKTKFRRGREEEFQRKGDKSKKQDHKKQMTHRGFDMWSDEVNDEGY